MCETKQRIFYCEKRIRRITVAKLYLEKFVAEEGWSDDREEKYSGALSNDIPRSASSSNGMKFEDVCDVVARCESLRAINANLAARCSHAKENARLDARTHAETVEKFRKE